MIDHYKFRYGASHTYWVHAFLGNLSKNLMKYKFNYALKGFLAYVTYNRYQHYKYIDSIAFLTKPERAGLLQPVVVGAGATAAVMLLI